ncbi:hypothetical protein [Halocatena marina]|nr:hypothetical protein [Halocatena marina]
MSGNHSVTESKSNRVFARVFDGDEHIADLRKEDLVDDFVEDPAFDVEVV